MVALNSLVLSMAFHTYLAHLVSKSKKKQLALLSSSKMFQSRNGSLKSPAVKESDLDPEEYLKIAHRANTLAKIVFAVLIITFNIVFWYIAITEQMKKPESFLL